MNQKIKILCLGNEFLREDSFAKELVDSIKNQLKNYEITNIKDSFQLIEIINKLKDREAVIVDVVKNLKDIHELEITELQSSKILTAHDLDASFFLQLLKEHVSNLKIIGLPMTGEIKILKGRLLKKIKAI